MVYICVMQKISCVYNNNYDTSMLVHRSCIGLSNCLNLENYKQVFADNNYHNQQCHVLSAPV